MKRSDLYKLTLLNLLTSPMRALLTVLGMAIGVGAILAVLTLGDAGKAQVQSEMARLGIDRVWLTAAQGERLTQGDATLLAQALHVPVTGQAYAPVQLQAGDREEAGVAVGCSPDYLKAADTVLVSGRALYPLEWRAGGRSALLGEELAAALAVTPGNMVSVGGLPFRCVGIVAQQGELSRVDAARALFLPMAVYGEWMGDTVHELTLAVPKGAQPQAVAAMAADVMEKSRGVRAETVTMQVQLEAANSVIGIFVDVLKWVAGICTLVGGIGVMNILLVSVRERRREIGVMKSLGAARWQICLLFLSEAMCYGLLGGALGLCVGLWLISTAGGSIGLHPAARPGDCALVYLAALAVGLLFGVLPAARAAGLRPVDALRED